MEIAQVIAAATVGMAVLTLVTAVARRIAGPYGRRGGPGAVLGVHVAGSADDAQRAVEDLREEVEQLRAEVAELRARSAELDEVQNRLDFAERMLAQGKDRNALPGGRA